MAEIGTDLHRAAEILADGGLVAIPTETVYGLAANALNEKAVAHIFEVKERPHFDPLIVHVRNFEHACIITHHAPEYAKHLAQAFWPGPLTFVLPKNESIPYIVSAGLDKIGVRAPRHPLTKLLLEMIAFPLAAPSANPFGYISPTTAAHVDKMLGDKLDYILDGGPCEVGIESTVAELLPDEIKILRQGAITAAELRPFARIISEQTHSSSTPTAPGQISSHYAPRCRLVLGKISCLIKDYSGAAKTALITFDKREERWPLTHQYLLAEDGSMPSAAANLFKALHWLDDNGYEMAYCEPVPEDGLGKAINDRLRRAAFRN